MIGFSDNSHLKRILIVIVSSLSFKDIVSKSEMNKFIEEMVLNLL